MARKLSPDLLIRTDQALRDQRRERIGRLITRICTPLAGFLAMEFVIAVLLRLGVLR